MAEIQSAPSLRELSEAASSGRGKHDLWFTNDNTPWILGPEADSEPGRFHVVARMPAIRRVDTDARRQWLRDRMFIVALVNAFRAGRLIDPTTLTEAVAAARAEGVRKGLERARQQYLAAVLPNLTPGGRTDG
jgi:hypothetical protein